VCGADSALVVTSSASGGWIGGLGATQDDSTSLFIDSGARLTLAGPDTQFEQMSARVAAGGQWRLTDGADVILGHDTARGISTFIGNDPDDVVTFASEPVESCGWRTARPCN
jgi:hypothetical protein